MHFNPGSVYLDMENMQQVFPGVWRSEKRIFTQSLVPGDKTYSKSVLERDGKEFREWNPQRLLNAASRSFRS